jgi:hypothetical protein
MAYNKRGIEIREPIKASFGEFELTARYKGVKSAIWDADSYTRHYVITVQGCNTRAPKISFDYWTSRVRAVVRDSKEVIEAFAMFLRDVESAKDTAFEDFAAEYGYLPCNNKAELKRALDAYKACVTAAETWDKISISRTDTVKLLEALDDAGFC